MFLRFQCFNEAQHNHRRLDYTRINPLQPRADCYSVTWILLLSTRRISLVRHQGLNKHGFSLNGTKHPCICTQFPYLISHYSLTFHTIRNVIRGFIHSSEWNKNRNRTQWLHPVRKTAISQVERSAVYEFLYFFLLVLFAGSFLVSTVKKELCYCECLEQDAMSFALDSQSLGMEVLLMSINMTVQFLFYMLEDEP